MKKIVFVLFMAISALNYAQQQNEITRTHYCFTIVNTENEEAIQQIVSEIKTYKGVAACKYRMKPEKKVAEIIFAFDEKPLKSESDKGTPLPNAKNMILDKGLQYNGFTMQTEKITN